MRMVGRPEYGLLAQLLWVTIVRAHWLVGSMWHSSHKAQKSRGGRQEEYSNLRQPQLTRWPIWCSQKYMMCLCWIQPISNQVSLLIRSMFVLNYSRVTQLFNHLNNTQALITFEWTPLQQRWQNCDICHSALVTDTVNLRAGIKRHTSMFQFLPRQSQLIQCFRHTSVTLRYNYICYLQNKTFCLQKVKHIMVFYRTPVKATSTIFPEASFSFG